MPSHTIEEIIQQLGLIVEESLRENSRLGLFAYVYKRTTEQIRDEIRLGNFEDNDRLEMFDVLFAQYYLDAFHRYRAGEPVSEAWRVAFDARTEKLTVIQHILLGMNAHINLDLAIAASRIMEGKPIEELQVDFDHVNEILAGLLDEMQQKVSKVSWLMFLLDWIGKRTDEKIINFSMVQARTQSWRIACELWSLHDTAKKERITEVDHSVSNLGRFIQHPKSKLLELVLRVIGFFEVRNTKRIIREMQS